MKIDARLGVARKALRQIAPERKCETTSVLGIGACYRNGRKPEAEYGADKCCDSCIAHDALDRIEGLPGFANGRSPTKWRWAITERSKSCIEFDNGKCFYVMATDNGEGDYIGLGEPALAVEGGNWRKLTTLPHVFRGLRGSHRS